MTIVSPPAADPRSRVVLLHSGGMSGRQWRKLAELLAPSHRVVAPDFLGSGEREAWPAHEPFHFSQDVDGVEQLLRVLADEGAGPVHLVGHSYGGFVGATVARRAPSLVRSFTAYDPVAFGVLYGADDRVGLDDLGRAAENPVFSDETTGGGDAWFEAFVDYWNGAGTWRGMPQAARDSFLRVGRKVFYEVSTLMRDRTPADAYAVVTAPSLLITGDQSPAAAQRVVAHLAAALPNARALTIEGAGHMGPISHAAQVNQAIAAHLASGDTR